jgi:hypothetical protein
MIRIKKRKAGKRFVESDQLYVIVGNRSVLIRGRGEERFRFTKRNPLLQSSPLDGLAATGMINQDMAHRCSSHGVEMRATIPSPVLLNEAKVSLMDKRRRTQRPVTLAVATAGPQMHIHWSAEARCFSSRPSFRLPNLVPAVRRSAA